MLSGQLDGCSQRCSVYVYNLRHLLRVNKGHRFDCRVRGATEDMRHDGFRSKIGVNRGDGVASVVSQPLGQLNDCPGIRIMGRRIEVGADINHVGITTHGTYEPRLRFEQRRYCECDASVMVETAILDMAFDACFETENPVGDPI